MSEISDFPKKNNFYFTRRGKFKVLAVKGTSVSIEWQDNREQVSVKIKDLKKQLIPERYAGDPDNYRQLDEVKPRFKPPVDDEAETEDEE